MVYMQKHTLAIVLVIAVLCGGFFLVQERQDTMLREQVRTLEKDVREAKAQPVPVVKVEKEVPVVESLADAIRLLPHPEQAVAGQKLHDGLYWVWAKQAHSGEEYKNEDQSWMVNVRTQEVRLLKTYAFGVPYGPKVAYESSSEKYFIPEWTGGWEGSSFMVQDVIDRVTGQLLYSVRLQDGVLAIVEEGTKKVEITLDPRNGCDKAVSNPHVNVQVKALSVNGKPLALPKPHMVTCLPMPMAGVGVYPSFSFLSVSDEGIVRLGLPWSDIVDIPLPGLDAARVHLQ
jgi:hypothetical protein